MIHLCGLHEVDAVWPRLEKGIQEACERGNGTLSADWLWLQCRKGDLLLLIDAEPDTIGSAAVFELRDGPTIHCHALYGPRWRELAQYAGKRFATNRVTFEGRAGWARQPGIREIRRVYEMGISDVR